MTETFGCSFAIAVKVDNEWEFIDYGLYQFAEAELLQLQEWLSNDVSGAASPQTLFLDDKLYVAAAVNQAASLDCVLVGQLQTDVAVIAARAAKQAMREAEFVNRLVEQEELVAHYSQRLSDSFEELSFLRKLTQHVEHCVADRDLSSIAKGVLPQLRGLLMVEGLLLVEAGRRDGDIFPRRILGSSGSTLAIESQWLQFLADLGPASRRTMVRNYGGGLHSGNAPWPGLTSLVLAPVQKNGLLFGWLIGINKQEPRESRLCPSNSLGYDEIGSMEASLLEATAVMLGTHAGNNLLFQEKESLIVDVIHTLVGVIEARDKYTCGHSDRVALIGRRLAHALGLSRKDCHEVFLSGLLHDIGKIGVSDKVLLKPGRLTDEEFSQIKIHPERGARLLRGLRPLERLIPGVLHHHEAMDGTGYPHGLKGEAIPMMARILAVADAFDAMTSDRPYRSGMPVEKAEAILREGAGTQWDPRVVDAFFSVCEDVAKICRHWQRHLEQLLKTTNATIESIDLESSRASAESGSGWEDAAYAELPSFVRDVETMLIGIR